MRDHNRSTPFTVGEKAERKMLLILGPGARIEIKRRLWRDYPDVWTSNKRQCIRDNIVWRPWKSPHLEGDEDGAIHALEQALKHHPYWTTAYDSLGQALKARGDHLGDIYAYEKAVDEHPRWQWGYEKLEAVYRSQGEGWRIIDKYNTALWSNPKWLWPSERLKKIRLEYGNKIPGST